MKKSQAQLLQSILLLFLASLFILIPLLRPGFIVTDDGDWMVIRLTAFYQAFADGQFPVRFLARLNNNYGYPVANFLYPGFLYIGSFLHLLKLPYVFIIEFILGGSVFASVLFLFLWLRKFFSNTVSSLGACAFLASPYLLYDLYKRGSVGELLGTAAFMMLLWAIEFGYVWFVPPVMALFLTSHNTLALLLSIVLLGYIIVRKKWDSIIPLGIGAVITSFFWLPAFFERSFVRFDATQVSNPFDFLQISQLLLVMSVPLFIPLVLFLRKNIDLFDREYYFFSSVLIISAVGSSILGMLFWKSVFFNRFIQFPYRMLSLLFVAGPWLFAFFLTAIKSNKKKWIGIGVVSVLFCMNIPLLWNVRSVVRDEGYYTTNEGTTTVQDEYMPKWVREQPKERTSDPLVIFTGRGHITIIHRSTKNIDATLVLEEESTIQLNTIFYPGWGAMLDGKPVEVSYQNPKGFMQIVVPKGTHTISFEFRETAFRYGADLLSSIGVILYGLYLIFYLTKGVKRT